MNTLLVLRAAFFAGIACVVALLALLVACTKAEEAKQQLDNHETRLKAVASLAHHHVETKNPITEQALSFLQSWTPPSGPPS